MKESFGWPWIVKDDPHLLPLGMFHNLRGFRFHKHKVTRKDYRELCAKNVGLDVMIYKNMRCSVRVYNSVILRKDQIHLSKEQQTLPADLQRERNCKGKWI